MSKHWMPLYVGDYIADTAHLTTIEHGAYLLLILHYWVHEGLPTEDAQLARIARTTKAQWRKIRPTIKAFFSDEWKHKRIEFELTEAARISAAGKAGGAASAKARRERALNGGSTVVERSLNDHGNDPPTIGQPLHLQSKKEPPPAANPEVELYRRGREVLGRESGGLIKKLLTAKAGDCALARAAIETASTKSNAREYIGGILKAGATATNDFWNPNAGIL